MKNRLLFVALLSLCAACRGETLVTTAYLSGAAESPTNTSPGTGFTIVTYDSTAHTLRVQVTFSDLSAGVTASHIHATVVPPATTAGVATQVPTFQGFPLGVTNGTYDHTLDLTQASSFNPAFITANGGTAATAEAALVAAIASGHAYLNIHTTNFPSGEIRGFLLVDSDADGIPDAVDAFPHSRDVGGNVMIEDCDTGVPNVLFPDGGTISDLIYEIAAAAKNHGQFVNGVAHLKSQLRRDSLITAAQASAIQSCAAGSSLP